MKVRLIAGSLLAAPALLVATATNGHASSVQGSVAFAGRLTITPSPSGAGTANVCFDASLTCAGSVGAATGIANAKPVTGMTGSLGYVEKCTLAAPYAPTGTGDLNVTLRSLTGDAPVSAKWQRFGLVAVITGESLTAPDVAGAAVVAPAPHLVTVPACGSPLDVVVTGAMAFA